MTSDEPHQLTRAQLSSLRDIDQAAAGDFPVGLDRFMDETLRAVATIAGTYLQISTAEAGHLWGQEPPSGCDPVYDEPLSLGFEQGAARLNGFRLDDRRFSPLDRAYMDTVSGQLELCLSTYIRRYRSEWLAQIATAFFDVDLHPEICFQVLAASLPKIFPDMRGLSISRADVVQVLINNRRSKTLTIVSTTGSEAGTVVSHSDSVAGMILDGEGEAIKQYLLVDPADDSAKLVYKDFATTTEIRSELVIPLHRDNHTIGILNLESVQKRAFGGLHAAYLATLTSDFSEMIDALRRQLESDAHSRMGVASAQSKYWESVGRILRHDLRAPANVIKLRAEEIHDDSNDIVELAAALEDQKMGQRIGQLAANVSSDSIKQAGAIASQEIKLREFVDQFVEYLAFGSYDVREIVQNAKRYAQEQLANSQELIRVIIEEPDYSELEDPLVYCSPLLKVFIFNIFDNSAYWIQQAARDGAYEQGGNGVVRIAATNTVVAEQAPTLNRFVKLLVTDNGPGASPEVISTLNDPRPGAISLRRGGQGYAMRAFRDYLIGLGGSLKFAAGKTGGFEVAAELPVFSSRRPIST